MAVETIGEEWQLGWKVTARCAHWHEEHPGVHLPGTVRHAHACLDAQISISPSPFGITFEMPTLLLPADQLGLSNSPRTANYGGRESKEVGVPMFGKKNRQRLLEQHQREEKFKRYRDRAMQGASIYKKVADLRAAEKGRLYDQAVTLFNEARHQSTLIHQSIADRTEYEFDPIDPTEGDAATWMAETIEQIMRSYTTNPQTFFEAMSEQLPKVNFTVDWADVVSLVASYIREERIQGILEGLQLAGAKREV